MHIPLYVICFDVLIWFDWHIDSDQILINYLVIIDKMYFKV